jgi:hypothetical protein
MPHRSLVFASLAFLAAARADAAPLSGYIDLLAGELVGEMGRQGYDVRLRNGPFVGTAALGGGLLADGGLGMREVICLLGGARVSGELSVGFGRLVDPTGPFASYSRVTRMELLAGLGYEVPLGRWVLIHSATVFGLDGQWLDAVGDEALGKGAAFELSRLDFRLGQQMGLHVHLAERIALFADGTLDYDGQWRVRAGFSVGRSSALAGRVYRAY